eukprot:TRINITY_DN16651_c0_g1_i4.p1 TRINITY_DN16651_c0_g1~~TRINITY_DN16651_c0_g1_i4.p1  ORF type:complete len:561 (+),score=67.73 TRINITY_DN16651_c0_g1_i4:80-1684(+)
MAGTDKHISGANDSTAANSGPVAWRVYCTDGNDAGREDDIIVASHLSGGLKPGDVLRIVHVEVPAAILAPATTVPSMLTFPPALAIPSSLQRRNVNRSDVAGECSDVDECRNRRDEVEDLEEGSDGDSDEEAPEEQVKGAYVRDEIAEMLDGTANGADGNVIVASEDAWDDQENQINSMSGYWDKCNLSAAPPVHEVQAEINGPTSSERQARCRSYSKSRRKSRSRRGSTVAQTNSSGSSQFRATSTVELRAVDRKSSRGDPKREERHRRRSWSSRSRSYSSLSRVSREFTRRNHDGYRSQSYVPGVIAFHQFRGVESGNGSSSSSIQRKSCYSRCRNVETATQRPGRLLFERSRSQPRSQTLFGGTSRSTVDARGDKAGRLSIAGLDVAIVCENIPVVSMDKASCFNTFSAWLLQSMLNSTVKAERGCLYRSCECDSSEQDLLKRVRRECLSRGLANAPTDIELVRAQRDGYCGRGVGLQNKRTEQIALCLGLALVGLYPNEALQKDMRGCGIAEPFRQIVAAARKVVQRQSS